MKTTRKQFTTLAIAVLAAMATGFSGHAAAQGAYPSKNVTLVVPTAVGGTTDLSARTTMICGAEMTLATGWKSLCSHCFCLVMWGEMTW